MGSSDGVCEVDVGPVADRVALFYAAYPQGCIDTELVMRRTAGVVVFRAMVYRRAADGRPAATGWGVERREPAADLAACIERAERSAVGRALSRLGVGGAAARGEAATRQAAAPAVRRQAPSAHPAHPTGPRRVADASLPLPIPPEARVTADLLVLIGRAEAAGMREQRALAWRAALRAGRWPEAALRRFERRLWAWVERERHAGARRR